MRLRPLCDALGLSLRTVQRWKKLGLIDKRKGPVTNAKSLSESEQKKILDVLISPSYCDDAPELVVAKLADKGTYLCSQASMYRILKKYRLNVYRRRGKVPTRAEKIETLSNGPNQVWTWDITYLRSWVRGKYFKLYAFEDMYSRKIVGWHVDEVESDELSKVVFEEALQQEKISGKNLRLHNDNGNVMRGVMFTDKLKSLGVMQSFSRPSVSNDNPYIEAFFKTLKYCPQYPYKPFNDTNEAREWVRCFINWYNHEHLHSGIGYVTPGQRHSHQDIEILAKRKIVYAKAKERNPFRWSGDIRTWDTDREVRLPKNSCRKIIL